MRKLIPYLVSILAAGAYAADEITVSANVSLTAAGVIQSQKSGDIKLDMGATSPTYNGGVVLIGTAWTALPVGGVTTNGFLWFKNANTNALITGAVTNEYGPWIQAGVTNSGAAIVPFGKVWNTELGIVPLDPDALIFFRAVTNNVPLQFFLITR
jgi:hypothetical protein